MLLGFIFTTLAIALTPLLLFFDGGVARGFLTALSAGALAAATLNMRRDEVNHLRAMLPRIAIVALLPAAWMLLQIIPLAGLGHPIWTSAGAALDRNLSASISVDPGATVLALGRYTGFVALGLAISIITVDRRRAEWTLFALLSATATIAVLMVGGWVASHSGAPSAAATIVAIGCIVAAATALRAYERSETRRRDSGWTVLVNAAPSLAISGVALVLCIAALLRFGQGYTLAAAVFGLGVFGGLALIRRLGFGVWGAAAICVALFVIAAAVISGANLVRSGSWLTALVTADRMLVDLTSRMLADVRWFGTGAGTFSEFAQPYRDLDDAVLGPSIPGPSTAAVIAVELGRLSLTLIVAAAIVLFAILVKASVERGRDSFFPVAGAASGCVLLATMIGDAGLLASALAVVATSVLGLAVAQAVGRGAR